MIASAVSPARVLMTGDTVGGVWTYAMVMGRALAESGVVVHLATMGETPSPEQRAEARAITGLELHQSRYRLPWMDQPWDDVRRAGDWLLDLTARLGPELIHLNEPVYGSLPWPVPVVTVAHSCVLSWWQSVRAEPAPSEWDCYRRAMARGFRQADVVVAPSRWMLEAVQRTYGVAGGKVVPNGRGAAEFASGVKAPIVFAAGRLWDPAKNLLALQAVATGLTWPVYVAGDPRQPGRDAEAIPAGSLHLLGRLPTRSLASWLGKASIYAFPARYEPFGLSVLEAALAGCALVLGDIPTLRELWEGSAVFVSPDDPETLGLAIEGLIKDSGLRHALAMRARRRALAFTPRRMALAYLQIYGELLEGASRAAQEATCAS
jgi:glycogen synthase